MVKSVRSTKGASKARRDHINAEIRNMRALLPISSEDQERLSYLHSMSVICTFIRKSVLLTGTYEDRRGLSLPYKGFLQALPGFIVALTKAGKLVYVSENVSLYLGLSMVDVLQGDSFYDMIDTRDVETVKAFLNEDDISSDRSFVCRMITSKSFRLQYGSCCSMLVRGHFQGGPPNSALFVALCTPTVNRLRDTELLNDSMCFQTLHNPDMSFTHAPYSVFFHLGFLAEELIGQSWYHLLHPDDLTLGAGLHKRLIQDDADVQMVVRLQCKDLSWIWIYILAVRETARRVITCKNHVISETEAIYLKHKLYSNVLTSSSQSVCSALPTQGPWSPGPGHKRQSECETQRGELRRKIRRMSENSDHHSGTYEDYRNSSIATEDQPALFSTPPYSPTSSHSSDFLSEGFDNGELLICDGSSGLDQFSPTRSPSDLSSQAFPLSSLGLVSHLYSDPTCDLHACRPDIHLVPVYQPVLDMREGPLDCVLHPEVFSSFLLSETHRRVSVYPEPQETRLLPAGLLTPESSPTVERHFHYSEIEQEEISILAHQICSLASSFDMYSTQRPVSQNSPLCWLASPSHSSTHDVFLDERVIDSILHDLDVVSVKEDHALGIPAVGTLVHSGPLESFSTEPITNTQICYETNSELHQLSHCLYDDIREDRFTEESMY